MTPTSTMEGEPPLVRGGEAGSRRLSSTLVDRGLGDILLDPELNLTEIDSRPAREVLRDYTEHHRIWGPDGLEELLGLTPSTFKPESAQAAILTTKSTDGKENTPYLVYKLPHHHGGDFPVDAVCVINISGELGKFGTKAYLIALRMSRKRHNGRIISEPALSVSTYDISPDSNYVAYEGYERRDKGHLHTTDYDPRSAHISYRTKRAVAAYEKAARFLDTLVKDPRAALALLNENGLMHSKDGFTITIERDAFNRITNEHVTDTTEQFFPYNPGRGIPLPDVYRMMATHAGTNGYTPVGKHAIIAALRHTEQDHTRS